MNWRRGRLPLVAAGVVLIARALGAQVAPDLHWQTLSTEHFRVHFSPGLEPTARRAAGSAERAWARLARELHAPRGPVELVVADNEDISNGFTTTFPTNRIVVFARPTVDANALKFLDDWIDLVVSHELAHVFHLDRSRGWWRAGQWVFGRNPFLFPNQYTPSWLAEGIAVHYESRLTGSGRIEGTEYAAIARAKALRHATPDLNALSASTLVWPLGSTAYVYGSLLVESLANAGGPNAVRDFIESSAVRTIPFRLNANAQTGFGISFDSAHRRLVDSISRALLAPSTGMTALTRLTTRGWLTQRLRWTDDRHLIFGSGDGRDVPALREVSTNGVSRLVARRNTLDVTSPLPDGARVFSQLDFTDPYTLRADLYLEWPHRTKRLTTGARLMQPDARWPAANPPSSQVVDIVAVQLVPGASRLVRVRYDGTTARVSPLTTAHPDTTWSEPRWNRAGTRIAATRWMRNGSSEIVVLDSGGGVFRTLGRSHAVNGAPGWARGDSAILFTSDRAGRPELYRGFLATGKLERIATAVTGLSESEESPDGTRIATLLLEGDGYHVALFAAPDTGVVADTASVLKSSRQDAVALSDAPAGRYSPWGSLLPHYWLPAVESGGDGRYRWGFVTSGSDVLGRHRFDVQATVEPRRGETSGAFSYAYAGWGNPLLGLRGREEWDEAGSVFNKDTVRIGALRRRRRVVDLSVSALRPRVRSSAYASAGAAVDIDDYRTDPEPLLAGLSPASRERLVLRTFPSVFVSAGWSNARRPVLAVSPEDGVQLSITARERWRSGAVNLTRSSSVVGVATAFKAFDLHDISHHVLALRAAGAWADPRATSEISAGGVSGMQLTIVPGVTLGEGRRAFPVRGFPAGAQQGIRALGGSAEYRWPIAFPSRGLGRLPLFFQRVSGVLFGDAATSWCPSGIPASGICPPSGFGRDWMASAGAELHLDAAYDYDSPYRFRLGAATPLAGRKYFGVHRVAVYVAVGLGF